MHTFFGEIVDQSSREDVWLQNGGAWFALALVNACLAEQKNRSRLAWFLGSLALGPLATFVIVVWAPVADRPPEPLHPFSNLGDRYLTLAYLFAVLTAGALFLGVLGQAWFMGAASAIFAVPLVVFLALYRRVRAERMAARANVHAE